MGKHRSMLVNIILYLITAYGLILSALIILWLITGERIFFVNIFVNTSPAVYYPLPFVLFLAILLREPRTFSFLLIPTIAVFYIYVPRFMPRTIESVRGEEIVLLTYNLQADNRSYEVLDGVLRRADADIVSLEEVNTDMADWLATNWSNEYPYFLTYSNERDISQYSGRYFMSRYPITGYEMVAYLGRLTFIRAELDVSGQSLVVYNVHLPPPRYSPIFDTINRGGALTVLLERTSQDSSVILMGDFNMTDQTRDYQRLAAQYQDSFLTTSTGLGTSWPNARYANEALSFMPSLIRIDYIWLTENIVPQETRVLREGFLTIFPSGRE